MLYERIDIERAIELIGSPSAPSVLVLLCDEEGATALRSALVARPVRLPLSWISLHGDDVDTNGFARRLLEALNLPEPPPGPLDRPAVDTIADGLNRLLDSQAARLLVIEGIETASSLADRAAVSYLLEFLPDTLRVILLTLQIPPVGIPRLLVRQRVQVFVLDGSARQ